MIIWLEWVLNPRCDYVSWIKAFSLMRKGGVNPSNVDYIISEVEKFRSSPEYFMLSHSAFIKMNNLEEIPWEEIQVILRKIKKDAKKKAKRCWHPEQGDKCSPEKGRVKIIKAHSIQNNKILSSISKEGYVTTFDRDNPDFRGSLIGKKIASTFLGFCNKHDAVFYPIEKEEYKGSLQQHFLYAYRAFVVASHAKLVASIFTNFGEQSDIDIEENKKIFNDAILAENYDIIATDVIELPAFYPIAVSSSFYLDFDFEGNSIPHSDNRMENLYLTVFPDRNKTYVLISYFQQDKHLYENIAKQIRRRGKIKSDTTMLIGAHCENVYFEPVYFDTFIVKYKDDLSKLLLQTQFDHADIDDNGDIINITSLTPPNYLDNEMNINFFGY